jgi:hypothetical protein
MKKDKKILILIIGIFFMCFPLSAGIWEVELEPYQEYLNLGYEIVDIKVDGLGSLGLLKKEKSILAIMNDYRDPTTYTVHNLTNFFSLYDAEDFEFEPIWGDVFNGYILSVKLMGDRIVISDIAIVEIAITGHPKTLFQLSKELPEFNLLGILHYRNIEDYKKNLILYGNEGVVNIFIDNIVKNINTRLYPSQNKTIHSDQIIIGDVNFPELISLAIKIDDQYTEFISFEANNDFYSRKIKRIQINDIVLIRPFKSNGVIDAIIFNTNENGYLVIQGVEVKYNEVLEYDSTSNLILLGHELYQYVVDGNRVDLYKIITIAKNDFMSTERLFITSLPIKNQNAYIYSIDENYKYIIIVYKKEIYELEEFYHIDDEGNSDYISNIFGTDHERFESEIQERTAQSEIIEEMHYYIYKNNLIYLNSYGGLYIYNQGWHNYEYNQKTQNAWRLILEFDTAIYVIGW